MQLFQWAEVSGGAAPWRRSRFPCSPPARYLPSSQRLDWFSCRQHHRTRLLSWIGNTGTGNWRRCNGCLCLSRQLGHDGLGSRQDHDLLSGEKGPAFSSWSIFAIRRGSHHASGPGGSSRQGSVPLGASKSETCFAVRPPGRSMRDVAAFKKNRPVIAGRSRDPARDPGGSACLSPGP